MKKYKLTTKRYFALLFIYMSMSITLTAQSSLDKIRDAYMQPEGKIAEEVLAPRYKNVNLSNLSPDNAYYATIVKNDNNVSIKQFANKYYDLGGLAIDPVGNRHQYLTNQTPNFRSGDYGIGFLFTSATTGKTTKIDAPKDSHISNLQWSPDGKKIAYFVHTKTATHVYVTERSNGKTKKVSKQPVLATLNTTLAWAGDNKHVFAVLIPKNRGNEPVEPDVLLPQIRMTTTEVNRLRTSPSLLQNAYEADLLEYYITGQLTQINVDNGKNTNIGSPTMVKDIDVAPNGSYVIVDAVQKPFSYIVPTSSFGWSKEIWDLKGNLLVTLQSSEVNEGVPDKNILEFENRSAMQWRPDGEGLSMILAPEKDKKEDEKGDNNGDNEESEDDKDSKKEDKTHKLIQWNAPFGEGDMNVVYESKKKFNSVAYASEGDALFISEGGFRSQTTFVVYPDNPDSSYTVLKPKGDDFYDNPGSLMRSTRNGKSVILVSSGGENVYLSGVKYHKEYEENAPQPFLDKVEIKTGEKERIFESSADKHESIVSVLGADAQNLVINRQSSSDYPNAWNINLETESEVKLTDNKDYNPDITVNTKRERIKIKRADGFEFWVEVILPANWDGNPLPGLIWHYPTEFDSQEDYDKSLRTRNINQYTPINQEAWPQRTPEIFTQAGYAIIKADWPIYSKDGTPNNGFIYSVQQNSAAVIDSVAARGYVDRHRMAIGGHSYGGFGTAHAMIQTSFFKAGIAGDANFNRTLTPFGFQRERSDLWRGKDKYLEMTPLLGADRLDGALLIYSGAADENVGTSPAMSWQMFEALNALGKTAALNMYPYAYHHTFAKEIVLDRWERWTEWLDHYVKNTGEHIPENELGK